MFTLYNLFNNYIIVWHLSVGLVFVALFISSLQNLCISPYFKYNGLMGRSIFQYRKRREARFKKVLVFFWSRKAFVMANCIRVVFIIAYFVDNEVFCKVFEIPIIFLLSVYIHFRASMTNNEADRINIIILISIVLGLLVNSANAMMLSIGFIAMQSMFCYFINGYFKFKVAGWRNGKYLRGILATKQYSIGLVRKYAYHTNKNYIFLILSWIVISWELLFVFCPIMPLNVLAIFLFVGMLFHLAIAIIMGLNTFTWTFVATYPAIFYLNIILKELFVSYL